MTPAAAKSLIIAEPRSGAGMAPSPTPQENVRTIRLPAETVRAIESRLEGSAFESVDAFVAFVLARLLESPGGPGLTEDDERTLKERLRSLGYID